MNKVIYFKKLKISLAKHEPFYSFGVSLYPKAKILQFNVLKYVLTFWLRT